MNWSRYNRGLLVNLLCSWFLSTQLALITPELRGPAAVLHPVFVFVLLMSPFTSPGRRNLELGHLLLLAVVGITPVLAALWLLGYRNRTVLVLLHLSIAGYCALSGLIFSGITTTPQ